MSMVTLSLSSNGHPVHCASVFLRNENFGWKLCYVFSSSLSHQSRSEKLAVWSPAKEWWQPEEEESLGQGHAAAWSLVTQKIYWAS